MTNHTETATEKVCRSVRSDRLRPGMTVFSYSDTDQTVAAVTIETRWNTTRVAMTDGTTELYPIRWTDQGVRRDYTVTIVEEA